WEVISPDLTSNDPSKQQQLTSGGLSIDATTAENHTTLTVISHSPIKEGWIWTGSDDGKVHLTQDGGETWIDLTKNINGMPDNGWVTQIVPSSYDEQSAFVVIDNHRLGDWKPHVFKTENGGKSWTNIVADKGIEAFALSFVQHPETPNLMFLGTEFGLYYSIDGGELWSKWEMGFPSVSVTDLKVHPRENDLVAATFGRSFWVLDDLGPLEELAKNSSIQNEKAYLFKTRPAYQAIINQAIGQRLTPAHMFTGDNHPKGAALSYWLSGDDSVTLTVSKAEKKIYLWQEYGSQGLNRTNWNLEKAGKPIYGPLMSPVLERPLVAPGEYTIELNVGNKKMTQPLTVLPDPRIDYDPQAFADNEVLRNKLEVINSSKDALIDSLEHIERMLKLRTQKEYEALADSIREKVNLVWDLIAFRNVQGAISDSPKLGHQISKAFYYMHSPYEPVTENDRVVITALQDQLANVQSTYTDVLLPHWQRFKRKVAVEGFKFD
ncbi:MAG: sialidase, partial [Bacteroidota bacterium]